MQGRNFAGTSWDWLTPFSVFTGVGVIVAYALLGSTWLTMKTEGALQGRMIGYARRIVPVLLIGIGIVPSVQADEHLLLESGPETG